MAFGLNTLIGMVLLSASVPNPVSVSLRLAVDRSSYVLHEPILLEWTVTNLSSSDVKMPYADIENLLFFECFDRDGKKVRCQRSWIACGGLPVGVNLPAGRCLRGWLDLHDYLDLEAGDELTLKAIFDSKKFNRENGVWSGKLTSNEVSLKAVLGKGADETAARLVIDQIRRTSPKVFLKDGTPVLENGVPKLEKGAHAYVYQVYPELCRRILRESKSGRLSAAAGFYLGLHGLGEQKEYRPPNIQNEIFRQYHQEAVRGFESCIKSEGASPYMRSLSKYYLLVTKLDGDPNFSRKEIEASAKAIIKDHPNTFAAMKAQEILDKKQP